MLAFFPPLFNTLAQRLANFVDVAVVVFGWTGVRLGEAVEGLFVFLFLFFFFFFCLQLRWRVGFGGAGGCAYGGGTGWSDGRSDGGSVASRREHISALDVPETVVLLFQVPFSPPGEGGGAEVAENVGVVSPTCEFEEVGWLLGWDEFRARFVRQDVI